MNEHNPTLSGIECGKSTIGKTIKKPSMREGKRIAIAKSRWYNEGIKHFSPQKSRSKFGDPKAGSTAGTPIKMKRVRYCTHVDLGIMNDTRIP